MPVESSNSFARHTSQHGAPARKNGLLRGGSLVAGVEVSVLVSEAHSLSATAAKTALEDGAPVTDHVIVAPDEVTVVFAVSNAGGADASRDVLAAFARFLRERTLLELITEHAVYENMVLVSLAPLHQAPYKGALGITARLAQINFARLASAGRDGTGAAAKTAAPKVNAGKQEPKQVEGTAMQKWVQNWKGRGN